MRSVFMVCSFLSGNRVFRHSLAECACRMTLAGKNAVTKAASDIGAQCVVRHVWIKRSDGVDHAGG